MQKIVCCNLEIKRIISSIEENSSISGKGYYKNDNSEIVVFFSSDDFKYKYVYKDNLLIVFCNESKYVFENNKKNFGEIKNGDLCFKITTLTSNIEVKDNSIKLDYSLYQGDSLIGVYYSKLSFN